MVPEFCDLVGGGFPIIARSLGFSALPRGDMAAHRGGTRGDSSRWSGVRFRVSVWSPQFVCDISGLGVCGS